MVTYSQAWENTNEQVSVSNEQKRDLLCWPGIMYSQAWKEPAAFSKQPMNYPSFCGLALVSAPNQRPFPRLDCQASIIQHQPLHHFEFIVHVPISPTPLPIPPNNPLLEVGKVEILSCSFLMKQTGLCFSAEYAQQCPPHLCFFPHQ